MKVLLLVLAAFVFIYFSLSDRIYPNVGSIGDTEAHWVAKCGAGKIENLKETPGHTAKTIRFTSWLRQPVVVDFINGVAEHVTYFGTFSTSDLQRYLTPDAKGRPWVQASHSLSREGSTLIEWTREDGATACYGDKLIPMLSIDAPTKPLEKRSFLDRMLK